MTVQAAHPAPWPQTKAALQGIFERRWYTNHGPAAQALERRLGVLLGVAEVVLAANPSIGLLMMMEALSLAGEVIVPALAPSRCLQALGFAGLRPVLCDVDPTTGHMTAASVRAALSPATAAILGVNRWGGACDVAGLTALAAERAIPLIFESGESFGCHVGGVPLGGNGAAELFAFDSANIVDGAGGACITTNDPSLAARLRNIRSSYGAGPPVRVVRTANGRLSEAQAALAALGLDNYAANQAHNAALHALYAKALAGSPTARLLPPHGVTASNHQTALCSVTSSGLRDRLVLALQNRAACVRVTAKSKPVGLPSVDVFLANTVLLPIGNTVSLEMAGQFYYLLQSTLRDD